MISKNIDVVVTSVLQTTAGKMIFGRYIDSAGEASRTGGEPTEASGPVTPAPSPQTASFRRPRAVSQS
jgi:hypothetical protein